jgi:hypothetical protein
MLLSFLRDTETHIKNILVKAHGGKSLSEYLETQKNVTAYQLTHAHEALSRITTCRIKLNAVKRIK